MQDDLLYRVRSAAREVDSASYRLERAVESRRSAMHDALDAGHTLDELADALGLSAEAAQGILAEDGDAGSAGTPN